MNLPKKFIIVEDFLNDGSYISDNRGPFNFEYFQRGQVFILDRIYGNIVVYDLFSRDRYWIQVEEKHFLLELEKLIEEGKIFPF